MVLQYATLIGKTPEKEINFMATKETAVTVIADATAELLRKHLGGQRGAAWSATTIAAEMQKRGHLGWNSTVVQAVVKKGRFLSVDEAASLLGVLKGKASIILHEIDEVAAKIAAEAGARVR